jgi:uroporphyrinogen decarboxylase
MSLEQISKKYGDKLAFHGGIDTQRILPFGTPSEVMSAMKHCVETLGANKRYVIAPSQEIMNDVPTDNIKALIDGIYKYRNL